MFQRGKLSVFVPKRFSWRNISVLPEFSGILQHSSEKMFCWKVEFFRGSNTAVLILIVFPGMFGVASSETILLFCSRNLSVCSAEELSCWDFCFLSLWTVSGVNSVGETKKKTFTFEPESCVPGIYRRDVSVAAGAYKIKLSPPELQPLVGDILSGTVPQTSNPRPLNRYIQ